MTNGLFREFQLPSHAMDHRAHERFLLDTYADRRAPESGDVAPRGWLRSLLVRVKRGE